MILTDASPRPIRILIADDHPMLRDGVSAVIGRQPDLLVIGEAANGEEAVAQFAEIRPDVTLMDLQMPGMSGVEAIEAIRGKDPEAIIIVLTTYTGDAQAMRAIRAGAAGYLLKSGMREELVSSIRAVYAGRRHIQPEVAQEIALHLSDEPLNRRELQILSLIASGNTNKQIASKLSLADDTIKSHIKNIFGKLNVSDRTHAVTIAAKRGIIEL